VDAATRDRLVELNRSFYSLHAADFSATRRQAWPGWDRVLAASPEGEPRTILDLGCGNGRLADACARSLPPGAWSYTGVDASSQLLADAERRLARLRPAAHLVVRGDFLDLEDPVWNGPAFDLVTLFGVLHHVPGAASRRELLRRAAGRVAPGGRLAVSFWQGADSDRLRARIVAPAVVGLATDALDPGDHLLRWGEGEALRYCRHCGPREARELVAEVAVVSGLRSVESFRADGADGDSNLYHLLARAAPEGESGPTANEP
jgi:SAM-dependent methyltransferase